MKIRLFQVKSRKIDFAMAAAAAKVEGKFNNVKFSFIYL